MNQKYNKQTNRTGGIRNDKINFNSSQQFNRQWCAQVKTQQYRTCNQPTMVQPINVKTAEDVPLFNCKNLISILINARLPLNNVYFIFSGTL